MALHKKIQMAKEILSPLFKTLGLSNDDVEAIFSDNVSDELSAKLKTTFSSVTTKSAAKADPEIRNHVMAQTLNGVEDAVFGYSKRELADQLDDETFNSINEEKKTSKKVIKLIESLKGSYGGQIAALKESVNSKGSKASEEYQKRIEELTNAIKNEKAVNSDWEQKFNTREQEFHKTRVRGELLRNMAGINWKDTTPEMVDLVTNNIVNKAQQTAGFSFDKNGNIVAHNKEDSSIGVFGEDKTRPLSVKEYVLTLAKPFVSKNDANRGGGGNGSPHVPNTKAVDTSKMTSIQRASWEHQQKKLKALNGN